MPKINSKAKEVTDFTPPPPGKYLVEVEDVEASETQNGDEMFKLKLKIIEGEFEGKFLFDNMVFSEKAMPRAKLIASRFGFDVSKDFELTEDMLMGRKVTVVVDRIEPYEKEDGTVYQTAKIAFAGYEEVEGQEKPGAPKKGKKF